MKFFSRSLKKTESRSPDETLASRAVADRLTAEARGGRVTAPPRLHGRVMAALSPVRSGEAVARGGSPGWLLRVSVGGVACGLLVLVAFWSPLDFRSQAQRVETASGEDFRFMTLGDYLEASARAEAPIHDAAAQMFLAEYENLGQDARSASAFVRSTTRGWMSEE